MRRLAVAVVAVWLVAAACSSQRQTCPAAPTVTTRGAPFLWKVTGPHAVVWLYGTIHDAGLDAVPAPALEAFAAAKRVATELGDEPADSEAVRTYARIGSGPGLEYQLPADEWYDLRDTLRGKIKEDDLRRAQPWYAMSLLTSAAAPSGKSMDVLLVERANERDVPIDALETWAAQLKVLSETVTLADLQDAIHARHTMHCDFGRMRTAYDSGDIDTMTALLVLPRTAEAMLYARNRAWLPALETYLAHDGAFVAVGLGHLLGEQSVPALLAKAGYVVERASAPSPGK
jgi:uncharacterized protein YbaP (TraB family)